MGRYKYIVFVLLFVSAYANTLVLSSEEKTLLNSRTFRCISTGLWAPFNLLENDELVGIGFDYWDLIREKLNIKSGCRKAESWTQVLDEIKNKTADVTIAGQPTVEREEYVVFSKPYATYPVVIATRNDVGYIDDINLLHDKTIAVAKGYAVSSLLKKHYPTLKVKYVESLDKALTLIDEGKVYGTIEILPVLAYKLNKHGFNNLKISGGLPYKYGVTIMLRKDYEVVLPLINKAIDSIEPKERNRIIERWTTIHQNKSISKRNLYLILFLLSVMLLISALWLYSLYKKMAKKNQTEEELKKLVYLDFLTSIYNRHMLDLTLAKEISLANRYNQPLSIIFFDIDRFKVINDTYGHKVGDTILEEMAKYVQENIRESDIFGRWGGDEFLLILPLTSEDEAKDLTFKLSSLIEEYLFSSVDIFISCSFGTTGYNEGETRQSLVSRADERLYAAKKQKYGD